MLFLNSITPVRIRVAMLVICPAKSLSFPSAIGAIAGNINLSVHNIEALRFGNPFLYVLVKAAVKFDHSAAVEASQVVVFGGWLHFVVMVVFIEVKFLYDSKAL